MVADGRLWVLVADGREARVFEERRRGGALIERTECRMIADDRDRADADERAPMGFASKNGPAFGMPDETSPHEAGEERFLDRVAGMIAEAAARDAFRHFVMFAPPRALGHLRRRLPEAVAERVLHAEPKAVVKEDASEIRERLKRRRLD